MSKDKDEIILVYKGKLPEHINGVPARDLTKEDIQAVADLWGISTTEAEGLLIKHKLYAFVAGTPKTTKEKAAEAANEEKE